MYEIIWTDYALEQLDKLEKEISRRIVKKIDELIMNPFSRNVKKLKDENSFRLRIGSYRVVFEIKPEKIIYILKVGHRKNIYKR